MSWSNRPNPFQGTPGPQGPPGEDGAEWHSVSGAPAGSLGVVGDWALLASTGQVWQKTGSATWTSRGSLRGPQGVQGETGPAGTITGASATTVPASSAASVTLGGTPTARTFAFGIPQGAKGDKGDTGAQGPKGDPGEEGSRWLQGTGAPLGSLGAVGDWYIRPDVDAAYYEKTGATTWTFHGYLRGPAGADGNAGVLGGIKAWRTASQSIPSSTWAAVNVFEGSNSSYQDIGPTATVSRPSASYCRVDSAGWWMVGFGMSWRGNSSGRRQSVVETWTGTDPGVGGGTTVIRHDLLGLANDAFGYTGSTVVHLDANTNVRLIAWQDTGSSLDVNPSGLARPTELWLTRIL